MRYTTAKVALTVEGELLSWASGMELAIENDSDEGSFPPCPI